MPKPSERVAAGAALLDSRRPGWYQGIDLNRLDIADPVNCVLGQTGGYFGYYRELNRLDIVDQAHAYGFTQDRSMFWAFFPWLAGDAFDLLTLSWRAEITKRRLADLRREFEGQKVTWTTPTAVTV